MRILKPSLPLLLTLLLTAATAQAATYTVHSCRTPTGRWVGAAGWTADTVTPSQDYDTGSVTSCGSPDQALSVSFGHIQAPVRSSDGRTWEFEAAWDTLIQSADISRTFALGWPISGSYDRGYVVDVWHDADESSNELEFRHPPIGGNLSSVAVGPVLSTGRGAWRTVSLRLRCWEDFGEGLCGPFHAALTITRADVVISDAFAPEGEFDGAAVLATTPIRGTTRVDFQASDRGGGVYRVIARVDGREVSRRVADQNGGACLDVEPDNGDPYEFASPQPCLLAAAGEIALDTRPLRDGAHTLELLVEDAAGNLSEVHEGTFETHNAPVLVGAPGIGGQARVGAALTATNGQWDGAPTGYDHRWLRCDADGAQCAPIAGASGAQYVATEADAYRRLVVEVVAENGSGAATARSTPSAPVADAAGRTTPPTVRQPADREPEGDGDDPPRPTPDADAPPRAPPVDTGGVGGLQNPIADQSGRSPNGTNASAAAKLVLSLRFPGGNGGSRRMTASAKQRMRLVGRLTDEQGRPIAGARLNLAVRVMGRRWAARGVVRTDRDGYARHRFAATSSRSIRLTYFPFASSRSFRASNAVVLDVRAPLTISLDRRRVSGKRVVTLRGRAAGGSIPAGGLLITLQGHQRGWGWRTFRTLRTARDGSWRTSYRFRSTSGRFGFRAVVPRQGRYPFLTTTSRPVFVSIR